ncbi:MAG TPA: DedA family protein [Candidatus Eremiobacteraeota bacterium]|nr:MAG: Inner membrane protein YohD [bacterium ADurb.Bin363]HPZ10174.1 DedA family protein [Candidatus Eremiobacteraeota bacterium]
MNKKIGNVLILIFLLGVIVLLTLYGNSFKEYVFHLLNNGDKQNKNFLTFLGYMAVLIGTILEGETVLFVSCIFCSMGYMSLPGIIIMATIGGSAGDNIYFHLVRGNTDNIVARSNHLQKWYPRVKKLVDKYGGWAVLPSRFLIGLRTAIALVCSSGKMAPLKFALINLLSAFLWASFFCCAIYYGGQTFREYFDTFKKVWIVVMPVLILLIITGFLVKKKFSSKNSSS